jgi:transposase-like protein
MFQQRDEANMTERKKRKVHSAEFKAKVGLEAVRGVKTINEISQEFGVHPVQVGQWKKEIQTQCKTLFEGKRGPVPAPVADLIRTHIFSGLA